jgi:hypothetical protein
MLQDMGDACAVPDRRAEHSTERLVLILVHHTDELRACLLVLVQQHVGVVLTHELGPLQLKAMC